MEALGDDGAIAVAGREDFVKVLVGPPVAVHTEAVGRVETEVVRLLQIRRTVETVMAVRRPTRPRTTRHIDLIEDESLGIDRRRQHMVDLAVGGAAREAHWTCRPVR